MIFDGQCENQEKIKVGRLEGKKSEDQHLVLKVKFFQIQRLDFTGREGFGAFGSRPFEIVRVVRSLQSLANKQRD